MLRHAFAHPLILYALLALPVLAVLAILARRRRRRVLEQFGAAGLRNALLTRSGKGRGLRLREQRETQHAQSQCKTFHGPLPDYRSACEGIMALARNSCSAPSR